MTGKGKNKTNINLIVSTFAIVNYVDRKTSPISWQVPFKPKIYMHVVMRNNNQNKDTKDGKTGTPTKKTSTCNTMATKAPK